MHKEEEEKHCSICGEEAAQGSRTQPKKGGLSSLVKLGACCAAPILALVILVPLLGSGAGGLASLAGNLLHLAALLACPLGMYFMMRSMQRMQHGKREEGHDKSEERRHR